MECSWTRDAEEASGKLHTERLKKAPNETYIPDLPSETSPDRSAAGDLSLESLSPVLRCHPLTPASLPLPDE